MPVKDMFKQVIQQVEPKLVITSGTAGAIGAKLQLGDVVVSNTARFKLDLRFNSAPFNHQCFTSGYQPRANRSLETVNSTLIAANADQLKGQRKGSPTVFTNKDQLGELDTTMTTDKFEFDDVNNDFQLQGLGAMVEMGDAVLVVRLHQPYVFTAFDFVKSHLPARFRVGQFRDEQHDQSKPSEPRSPITRNFQPKSRC
jgi:hypothetical protein